MEKGAKVVGSILPFETALFGATSGPTKSYTYQRSFLPYMSLEFVRLGAERIAVPSWDPSSRELGSLPDGFADSIRVVDPKGQTLAEVEKFLEPVLAEIPVEFALGGFLHRSSRNQDPVVVDAIAMLRNSLARFVVGIRERLHVEIDVLALKQSLEVLDKRLQTPTARLVVARFSGLLQTYDQVEVDSVQFKTSVEKERVAQFLELIALPAYRELSGELGVLGIPGKTKQAVTKIKKLTKWLQLHAKQVLKIVAVPVAIVSFGKVKLQDVADLVKDSPYFPVLTSFKSARAAAVARFRADKGIKLPGEQFGDQVVVDGDHLVFPDPRVKFKSREALEEALKVLGAKPIVSKADR